MLFEEILKKLKSLLEKTPNIEIHELKEEYSDEDIKKTLKEIMDKEYRVLLTNDRFRNNFLDLFTYIYIKEEQNKINNKYKTNIWFDGDLIDKLRKLNAINSYRALSY